MNSETFAGWRSRAGDEPRADVVVGRVFAECGISEFFTSPHISAHSIIAKGILRVLGTAYIF